MTSRPLRELAILFLRLGATAFGGPAAHIAMMEEEVVRKKQWLARQEFLDLLGATNLIPGPNSTEMAIHIGYKMGGWRGLLLAGSLFILPAFLIVWATAWFYMKYGSLPEFQSVFAGVTPVILAIIAQATWNLSQSAVKDKILAGLAVLSLAMYLYTGNEILVLFVIAILNLLLRFIPGGLAPLLLFLVSPMSNAWAQNEPLKNGDQLFLYFTKIGSVLFGSGYVLIAFLQNDLVNKYQWITQQQLLDAIAAGQFTPGPVFTTATFIGYIVSGNSGAIAATLGIFLPAFFFVAVSAPFIPALRKSKWTYPILDGLNVASLSLMAGAALILGKGAATTVYGVIAFLVSLLLLLKFRLNSVWLILAAAGLGYVFQLS